MWRPGEDGEEWKNPYINKDGCWEGLCFERGADARPEGCEVDYSLNKMDRPNDHLDDNNFRRGWEAGQKRLLGKGWRVNNLSIQHKGPGVIVFIPEAK